MGPLWHRLVSFRFVAGLANLPSSPSHSASPWTPRLLTLLPLPLALLPCVLPPSSPLPLPSRPLRPLPLLHIARPWSPCSPPPPSIPWASPPSRSQGLQPGAPRPPAPHASAYSPIPAAGRPPLEVRPLHWAAPHPLGLAIPQHRS